MRVCLSVCLSEGLSVSLCVFYVEMVLCGGGGERTQKDREMRGKRTSTTLATVRRYIFISYTYNMKASLGKGREPGEKGKGWAMDGNY